MPATRWPAFLMDEIMELMYKCAICGKEYGLNGFTNHIQRTHKIKYQEYYDTYVDKTEHLCPICGNKCAFTNYAGYRDTCGNPTCVRKLQHIHMKEKYGKSCCRLEKRRSREVSVIEYKFHCELCGRGFLHKNKLNAHLNKFHPLVSIEEYYNKYFGVKVEYCEVCGKKALWKGVRYHNTCGSTDCTAKLRSQHNAMHNPEYRKKAIDGQLNMSAEQKRAKKDKMEATCLKKFGVRHNWQSPECREKCNSTNLAKYGTMNMFRCPKAIQTLSTKYGVTHFSHSSEFAKRRKKKYIQGGYGFDSRDEINLFNFATICGMTVVLHPDTRFTYVFNGKTHYYEPDFAIDDRFYEVKGKQFFKDKDESKEMVNPYDHSMDDLYEAKHQCMLSNGVHVVTDTSLFGLIKEFYGVDLNEEKVFSICFGSAFPGTGKWPANHPIWDCFVPGHKTPRDAWTDDQIFRSAVRNLLTITMDSISRNKYHGFCRRHIEALVNAEHDINPLAQLILNRFTVAKLAPKVTALRASDLLKIIEGAGVSLANGVYCPMAGFGGIVEGARQWFTRRNLSPNIEAYDINMNFCTWYGWVQRDVMAQVVTTDKTVIVCPPFGKQYEHWKGTPDEMSDITFLEWVDIIKEHVKAPNYIFIGPETDKPKSACGLFARKVGIALYKENSDELQQD